MSKEPEPFTWSKTKSVAFIVILILIAMSIFACKELSTKQITTKDDNPKFVISSWNFPDEYGQGIDRITVYENSTSAWVSVGNYDYDEISELEWNASVGIKFKVWTYFNSTLTGASNTNDGKNYQQHNVIVTQSNGTIVFSQQNFTYSNAYPDADPMWYYVYEVVLDFLPIAGEIYTATVTYEIWW